MGIMGYFAPLLLPVLEPPPSAPSARIVRILDGDTVEHIPEAIDATFLDKLESAWILTKGY